MKNDLKTKKSNYQKRWAILSTHFKREMIVIVGVDLQFPIRNHCPVQPLKLSLGWTELVLKTGSSVGQQAGTAVRIPDSTHSMSTVLRDQISVQDKDASMG